MCLFVLQPSALRQKLLDIKQSREPPDTVDSQDSTLSSDALTSPTRISVDEGYVPNGHDRLDSSSSFNINSNSSAAIDGKMPKMERLGDDLAVLPVGEVAKSWQTLAQQYTFFQLDVHLKEGCDLAIRDRSGMWIIIVFYLFSRIHSLSYFRRV